VLRIVVRTGNLDLLDLLLEDVQRLLPELEAQPGPLGGAGRTAFHH
jgi:glutamate decarboxylase